jgi:hypothetical protein
VEKHFARRIGPAEERALRQHLPGCDSCRTRYERHLLVEGLDPARPAGAARLAVGLGLPGAASASPRPRPQRLARTLGLMLPLAGAAALLLWWMRPSQPDAGTPEFQARGGGRTQLLTYRLSAGHPPSPVVDRLEVRDELAFVYRNPRGWPYLLVFGVDEHGHVYWYHPGWADQRSQPRAVPVEQGARSVELPEGIAHAYDGERLVLHALFTAQAMTVQEMEMRLRSGPVPWSRLGEHLERSLRLERRGSP